MTTKMNLTIRQGETFQRLIRWESPPYIYKAITAITKAAPVAITAAGHGLATGWRVAVVSVLGMKEINARNSPPRDADFHQVTTTGTDAITINDINSADYTAYTSGGYLQFYTPVDLAGFSARLTIKDRIGGTVLETLVSPTDIALDNALHTITITISAVDTAALVFTKGVYDLELVSGSGVVTTLYSGNVLVTKEVTT
jgi:hypothetical protein